SGQMDRMFTRSIALCLGLTTSGLGCTDLVDGASDGDLHEQAAAKTMTNGLTLVNGLSNTNGLSGTNGLSSTNGLAPTNALSPTSGLSSTNGLMTTAGGRRTVAYLVKCALGSGDSLVKADNNGTNYTFPGSLGLCPAWKSGNVATNWQCQELISACLMAHLN